MVFKHIDDVAVNAIFSDCHKYRYSLTIENKAAIGNKTICVIMQNPSDANAEVADKSVQFLEKLIYHKGYTQFKNVKTLIIVNQFAYIQTNNFTGSDEYVGTENDKYIRKAIKKSEIVMVAWGVSNSFSERKEAINKIIAKSKPKILLQTKKHPSRGTYIDFVRPYYI